MLKPWEQKLTVTAAVVAAPLFIVFAILHFGVPIPYWDQWELVPLLQKLHDHTLTIADLWAQHNEHRIILPRAVMLLLASNSGWNIYYEFLTSYLIAVATFLFLWSMLRNTFQNRPPAWLVVAFSLVVFSPTQLENWLWGWQMQFFMTVLGGVVAAWALQRWPGTFKGLLIAIVAAIFSTYSLSTGLFVWVAVLPLLFFTKPRNWRLLAGWCIGGATAIGLYLYHYVKPAQNPPLMLFAQHPLEFIRYVLMYLGSPLAFGDGMGAMFAGIMLPFMALTAFVLMRTRNRSEVAALLPWLGLGFWAIICACATGIGRLGLSPTQALSSRYSTLASLLLLATLVIVAKWLATQPRQPRRSSGLKAAAIALLAVFFLAYLVSFVASVRVMQFKCSVLTECQKQWLNYPNTSPDVLALLYPPERINLIRERTETLRQLGVLLPKRPESPH